MKITHYIIIIMALSLIIAVHAKGEINNNFDNGLQGWTMVKGGPEQFYCSPLDCPQNYIYSWQSIPHSGQAHVQIVFMDGGDNQDSAHGTLWLQSMQFKLSGSGDLTAWLAGGTGSCDYTGTRAADIPEQSSAAGFLGLALLNHNTGVFDLVARKTSNSPGYEKVTMTTAQLTTLDQDAVYSLNLIDSRHGGWGWVNLDTVSIPGIIISSSNLTFLSQDQTVDSTEIDLSGTSESMVRGLWYEVRGGSASGAVLDFGALRAKSNWSITVRHLQLGANVVTVFGKDDFGNTHSNAITLTLESDFSRGSVRPRPCPSEIWFGGLSVGNPDLANSPEQWPFVRQHVDGIMFHSAWDGGWTGDSRSILTEVCEPDNIRYIEEMGDVASSPNFSGVSPAGGWGGIVNSRESDNVFLTEIAHDYHPEKIEEFCRVNPDWPASHILEWFTGETYGNPPQGTYPHEGWRKAFEDYYNYFPHAKVSLTKAPSHLNYLNYPPSSGNGLVYDPLLDENGSPVLIDDSPVSLAFDFADILQAHLFSGKEIHGHYTYFTDQPFIWLQGWGDGGLNYDRGVMNREKIRTYESYLHDHGGWHTMICNTHIGDRSSRDEWDVVYKDESLKSMYLYQADGGVANRYVFESWYSDDDGILRPYSTVPETKDGSYSNMALDALKYLKGIKYPDAALQELTLTVTDLGDRHRIDVRNDGDFVCLPALLAIEQGGSDVTVTYTKPDATDITAQITSDLGYVYHKGFANNQVASIKDKLLQPGESFTVYAVWDTSEAAPTSIKTVSFEVFWNPQDPSGIIRDKQTVYCNGTLMSSDFDFDCDVDIDDLAILASKWLNGMDMSDFAELSKQWLQ